MNKIKKYLQTTPYKDYKLTVASADASFRKYYRLTNANESLLLMDSSLEKESLSSFIDITTRLFDVDVKVPQIFEKNIEDGFLIIEDFGETHFFNILDTSNFKTLYTNAINEIVKMQKADTSNLPVYDKEFLHFEMNLMREWYIEKNLSITLSLKQKKLIEESLNAISNVVLLQPQNVFVHRDFHSRNIMLEKEKNIGIIDYQDAMNGAITYDLVSLLKDCYLSYERKELEKLVLAFRDKLQLQVEDEEFLKWFDFMGLQRHIKVLGVFSRLSIRDKKDGYLKDIPLTLKYVLQTASRYEETKEFSKLLQELTK